MKLVRERKSELPIERGKGIKGVTVRERGREREEKFDERDRDITSNHHAYNYVTITMFQTYNLFTWLRRCDMLERRGKGSRQSWRCGLEGSDGRLRGRNCWNNRRAEHWLQIDG